MLGADNAQGEVLIFLDSHCEATDGWIEPLLVKVKEKPEIAVVPFIEIIFKEDFRYVQSKSLASRGVFNWNLLFKWSEESAGNDATKSAAVPIK